MWTVCHGPRQSKRRRGRICLQHGTKCTLERTEPRLVVAPMVDRIAKNRLADLLRTRCSDSPFILVEAQAAFIERQAAVVEHPAHFSFEVINQFFVNDAMDAPR